MHHLEGASLNGHTPFFTWTPPADFHHVIKHCELRQQRNTDFALLQVSAHFTLTYCTEN